MLVTVYNKKFERILIVLIILFGISSFFYPQLLPIIFIIPAFIFLVRMIQDIRIKNDKKASKNLTTMIIFIIGIVIATRVINLLELN